jgi:hypothetical protein
MTVEEEFALIKKAKESVAEIDFKKQKIFEDLVEQIQPSGRLESTMWDYVINGINCYEYDIEPLLKNRKKTLDDE